MNKTLSYVLVLSFCLFMTAIPALAQETQIVMTQSGVAEERVAIYDEPSVTAWLKGEYFDGVQVVVLEYISNEWAKIDIPTYGEGGQGFVQVENIVSGSEAAGLVKTTIPCKATSSFILNTAPVGQSGDIGPFEAGTQVEVLGLTVPGEATNITRPLAFEASGKHVRIGDVTGFLIDYGDGVLIQTEAD